MRKLFLSLFIVVFSLSNGLGQDIGVTFKSSDAAIENAFNWAKTTALSYRHDSGDPVGPWYNASLPGRYAFCMRDVSHQSVGAEILGMSKENKNMFTKFVANISKSKDWCSYWEINKWDKPAPADYKNDKEFWYNLDANFDVLFACWRLYLWTGNKMYINSPLFLNFDKKTLTSYIHDWVLEPDSLLTRPPHANTSATYNESNPFQRCRGLPSYAESVQHGLVMGVDLVAAIYRGDLTYASMLKLKGDKSGSNNYMQKAKHYQKELENNWWDRSSDLYNSYYTSAGKFGKGEGETFLLWFNILRDTSRINATINHLTSIRWNVENTSYLPYLLYEKGHYEDAYQDLLYLSDPTTERRDYPEVSFGVVQGIVLGYMGVEPDAPNHTIRTFFRGKDITTAELDKLPLMQTTISLKYDGFKKTTITDNGKTGFSWKVIFHGRHTVIQVGDKSLPAKFEYAPNNHVCSYTVIRINPGEQVTAFVK